MSNERPDDAPARASRNDKDDGMVLAGRSVTINRPRAELYAFWADFSNLPRFMKNVRAVNVEAGGRTNWIVKTPGGEVTIKTEAADIEENTSLGWRSVEGSDIVTEGRVTFVDAPAGRGTVVTADIGYEPPAGDAGRAVAKLLGAEPDIQARHELKRFKMLMETGEIATAQNRRGEE